MGQGMDCKKKCFIDFVDSELNDGIVFKVVV